MYEAKVKYSQSAGARSTVKVRGVKKKGPRTTH